MMLPLWASPLGRRKQKQESLRRLCPPNVLRKPLLVGFRTTVLYVLLSCILFFWPSSTFIVLDGNHLWYCLTSYHVYKLFLTRSMTTLFWCRFLNFIWIWPEMGRRLCLSGFLAMLALEVIRLQILQLRPDAIAATSRLSSSHSQT